MIKMHVHIHHAGGNAEMLELQDLRLVSQGKTNRDIARDLVLSEKTVKRHLDNIFNKSNLSSRTAATAYALRGGLV